jgi:hypothetical protein
LNLAFVYSRAVISWQLVFSHASKMLRHLKSALLMTLASAGVGFAWFCCWLDRFLSGNGSSWIISARPAQREAAERLRPEVVAEKLQPVAMGRTQPRTIDSLIRNKGAGISSHFN